MAQSRRKSKVIKRKSKSRRKNTKLSRKRRSFRMNENEKQQLEKNLKKFQLEMVNQRLKNLKCSCGYPTCADCKKEMDSRERPFPNKLKIFKCSCDYPTCTDCKKEMDSKNIKKMSRRVKSKKAKRSASSRR